MEILERKVGKIFEFQGQQLKVKKTMTQEEDECHGCFFDLKGALCCLKSIREIIGKCSKYEREDNKNVIFVKVEE